MINLHYLDDISDRKAMNNRHPNKVVVKNALTKNCLVMGDFNLDVRMELRHDYNYNIPLRRLTDFTNANNLIKLVKFNNWSQTVNGVRKESLLDHIYVDDIAFIKDIDSRETTFGDHLLAFIELTFCDVVQTKATFKKGKQTNTQHQKI